MLLVNLAQETRYQYPVYLIGLFSLALLFWPQSMPSDKMVSSGSIEEK
jgi:hypothetical protein